MFSNRIVIPASHGELEAIHRPRRDAVDGIALLLHPHPQFGGTMHNKVIYRGAKALEDLGFETLRFNFRGVEASTGQYDQGRGEADDAVTALDYLRAARPSVKRCLVLGFSFGAGIAFRLAELTGGIDRILSVATPAYAFATPHAPATAARAVFIHGAEDDIAPLRDLREHLATVAPDAVVRVIAGADHFFTGHLDEFEAAVTVGSREPGTGNK